jgi:pilus assembly protein CpaB
VRVNDVVGVAGFALPGNFVDIIVHTQAGEQQQQRDISKIVLERILVLAVAQEVSRDDTKPRVVNAVTLEVTPEQAEHLDLARSVGSLSLALRNQVDPRPGVTSGATKGTLLGLHEPAPAAETAKTSAPPARPAAAAPRPQLASAPARQCISVINGLHSSRECL